MGLWTEACMHGKAESGSPTALSILAGSAPSAASPVSIVELLQYIYWIIGLLVNIRRIALLLQSAEFQSNNSN